MVVKGYKCFNNDMTNNNGFQFRIGNSYSVSGEIKAGTLGNGYHMCKRIEDTFRYYGVMNLDICVCEVIGSGKIVTFEDDYNGYYDMYSVEKIEIVRKLDRCEIIEMMLNTNELRANRFVQVFKLNSNEIKLFEDKYKNYSMVMDSIAYYQKGQLDVYSKKLIREKR